MPKATIQGFDDFLSTIEVVGKNTEDLARRALYSGAGIMADALKTELYSLPTVKESNNIFAYGTGEKMRLSEKQKAGLLDGLGIAPFDVTARGEVQTKVGFQGYNEVKTKRYPNGQPNQMIARVVESGSSYMDKNPFIRRTISRTKKQAEEKMREVVEKEMQKEME